MALRNTLCIYDHNHTIQIFNKNSFTENRCLNINVIDFNEYLQIKVRDASDFVFNYTTQIDLRQFELMRNEQCLDIDFNEFRSNLIDMLHQVQKHEMFLKCEIDCNHGKLVFYGKSRIKAIIYLTIDLQVTSQKEIFDEMNNNILELQNANKNLISQLQKSKSRLLDKDSEIEKFVTINKQLEKRFLKDLDNINFMFSKKLQECSKLLLQKILQLTQKLLKLIQDVEVVKAESVLKSQSSARLVQSLETLRLEYNEISRTVDELKKENYALRSKQRGSDEEIDNLNDIIQKQDAEYKELAKKKDEYEKDAKQAAIIIAQKAAADDELKKDLAKANKMLVTFNQLFEEKNTQIEELNSTIVRQEKALQDHNQRFHELCHRFEEYKVDFNEERINKLQQELFAARRKVEETEKVNRETAKLNELLTRKLASGDFVHKNFH